MNVKRMPVLLALLLIAGAMVPLQARVKAKTSQRVQLGVWEDLSGRVMTPDSIERWIKPFYEAGIRNFYICNSPEEIAKWVQAARGFKGARIHAWMFSLNAHHDSAAVWSHREWGEVNRLGENSLDKSPYTPVYKWLSPAVPQVRRWVKDKAAGYAAIKGLASVHLDFIRFNDLFLGRKTQAERFHIDQRQIEPQWDFGYHPMAIEAFRRQFGYSPLELSAPYLSPEWIQFRMDEVTSLVNEIAQAVHARGKMLTAAVFPFPERARMMVLQDWARWDLDMVCPMNYNSFYREGPQWVKYSVLQGLAETRHRSKYVSGLFVVGASKTDIVQEARESVAAGADGINFFSASGLVKAGMLDVERQLNREFNGGK